MYLRERKAVSSWVARARNAWAQGSRRGANSLQLSLQLLEVGIIVSSISRYAFEVVDCGDNGRRGLLLHRRVADRTFDCNVAHVGWLGLWDGKCRDCLCGKGQG